MIIISLSQFLFIIHTSKNWVLAGFIQIVNSYDIPVKIRIENQIKVPSAICFSMTLTN